MAQHPKLDNRRLVLSAKIIKLCLAVALALGGWNLMLPFYGINAGSVPYDSNAPFTPRVYIEVV